MYKSAKVKAQELVKALDSELPLSSTIGLGYVNELLYKTLLEHERDTRNCIIDNVLTLGRFTGEVMSEDWNVINTSTVSLDDTLHIIHNTNVGE